MRSLPDNFDQRRPVSAFALRTTGTPSSNVSQRRPSAAPFTATPGGRHIQDSSSAK
jgi:hypothetical protein